MSPRIVIGKVIQRFLCRGKTARESRLTNTAQLRIILVKLSLLGILSGALRAARLFFRNINLRKSSRLSLQMTPSITLGNLLLWGIPKGIIWMGSIFRFPRER